MAAGTGIYITWITGAIILSIAMMPLFKPPYARLRLEGFIDMFRRYWAHMIVVFSVYLWKDLLDGMDRVLMASTKLDMTPYVYAIEGDIVLWVQQELRNAALDQMLTHFYVMGFMTATFASFLYPIYFDDRHMADRVSLSMFWVYIIAIPFFLFFNVGVTGDHIPSMQTIAYDLTPEIHNWFTRIDPFSNGMPSLHIGLPFAIWLTMQRWDEDGRWANYRNFLIAFMLVTAFSIIYLGIHWIVDIIGGMAVAILAVELTAKTHSPIWKVADERLFSRRLARAIADPSKSLRGTLSSVTSVFEPLKEPNKRQTSVIIAALLLSTGFVLLWDATHQDFPVEGVEWPTSAAGSDGWLVSVEEVPDGSLEISVWNVSDEVSSIVSGAVWETAPMVSISGPFLALHDAQRVDFYELQSNETEFSPKFSRIESNPVLDVAIAESVSGEPLLVIVHEDSLEIIDGQQSPIEMTFSGAPFSIVTASGQLLAWADTTAPQPTVNVTSLEGPRIAISLVLDAGATEPQDEYLEQISGIAVDYENAKVVDIAMDPLWVTAVVDVGPVNRTILINILTGEQTMISEPVWPSSSPSVAHGRVAFLQIPLWDPSLDPEEIATARDVYLHDIEANTTLAITHDDDVDQLDPQVLLEDVAWVEVDSDGKSSLKVYSGETFQPYSSVILQAAILMLIPLLFLWAYQAASERRG
uniref:Phosphoesterase PA-phosphatase related protein n=1 Tax=uncultured marine group II/III euryarchaeote AD1000_45_F09 TaxID=1457776 RepID=A0A075FSP4_9EURY|nr:phosphoesterase PA-phosphatase related protein [uncultured marine group II/III euryarchaeote AD1000_45_F09]